MAFSMGNIHANQKVGLYFIEFETPHRVRLHGTAQLRREPADLALFLKAELVVKVSVEDMFPNCPHYIHRHNRIKISDYVPKTDGPIPMTVWKRLDAVHDVILTRNDFMLLPKTVRSPWRSAKCYYKKAKHKFIISNSNYLLCSLQ
ncbi:MAG: pyridoxamine 5'-phosphate oxidase family protein [Methylophaga sp.]|nr:pyridoxamine 5'-phosphate oxidase family protein [Methylophaga sp.]